jgi:hypothetical protein
VQPAHYDLFYHVSFIIGSQNGFRRVEKKKGDDAAVEVHEHPQEMKHGSYERVPIVADLLFQKLAELFVGGVLIIQSLKVLHIFHKRVHVLPALGSATYWHKLQRNCEWNAKACIIDASLEWAARASAETTIIFPCHGMFQIVNDVTGIVTFVSDNGKAWIEVLAYNSSR